MPNSSESASQQRRVAFLSMDNIDAFECYDAMLEQPLLERGWLVDTISWRAEGVDWNAYEAVVVRSPWDYQDDHEAFDAVLERIDNSSAQLENPLELMRWNMHKGYLRELELKGIPIVPTRFCSAGDALPLDALYDQWATTELILKPAVSANADHTHRLGPKAWADQKDQLEQVFQKKDALVQPFLPGVLEEGEYSVFYFGEAYSHTILKTPEQGDFRVQEEHGGRLQAVVPEPSLRAAAEAVMAQIRPRPLYARVDLVRDSGLFNADGSFLLMEVELIEPSLYFNLDSDSPARFAQVFDAWMRGPEKEEEAFEEGSEELEADHEASDHADDAPEQPSDSDDDGSLDWIWG